MQTLVKFAVSYFFALLIQCTPNLLADGQSALWEQEAGSTALPRYILCERILEEGTDNRATGSFEQTPEATTAGKIVFC